jgi:hypothetical protein
MSSSSPVTLDEMNLLERARFTLLAVILLACSLVAHQTGKPAPSHAAPSSPDPGSITNGVYRSSTFGFTYKIPFAWVDRTKEMSDDSSADANAAKKSILLLAVFEHPPEAASESVNSAVVVAAEPTSSYPGLQNAAQYFGPLSELTKSKGLKVVNEPYDYSVGTRELVRGDFSKPLGNLTMYQSTLAMIDKGYMVSFTFIGGSDEEVDELAEGLSFGKPLPAVHK